jgi:hypothetical protein
MQRALLLVNVLSTITGDFSNGIEHASQTKRGRPSGTSIVDLTERRKIKADCVNEITAIYAKEIETCKLNNKKTAFNFLKKLVSRKWEEYDLDPALIVSCDTIRSRLKRGILEVENRGCPPLLPESIEKVIVDVVVTMSKIRHPLCVFEIIALANSIIAKSEYQEKVIQWKSKMFPDLPIESCEKLGYGWWRGFSKRYEDVLVVKRGEKFASDRSEWSKEIHIRQMYDVIYDNMVNAGIASKLDQEVFMNADGMVVDNPANNHNFDIIPNSPDRALGLPCNIKIIHPEYLLFFDETGCNTNQKKDGHNGGQKFGCGRRMTPKQISSTRDRHFTVLGLTAATGEPVLCVVIFTSDRKRGRRSSC